MIAQTIAQRYAEALFRLVQEKELGQQVKDELTAFNNLYQNQSDFRRILDHPLIGIAEKFSLLKKALKDKTSPLSQKFLELLIRKGRLKYLPELIIAYNDLIDRSKGIVRVQVKSFFPLTKTEESQLKNKLSWLGAREIILETTLDRSLLGGMLIQIGDTVIDGSVRTKLNNLREHLLSQIGKGKMSIEQKA